MTEKLFTGTLNHNKKNKQKNYKSLPSICARVFKFCIHVRNNNSFTGNKTKVSRLVLPSFLFLRSMKWIWILKFHKNIGYHRLESATACLSFPYLSTFSSQGELVVYQPSRLLSVRVSTLSNMSISTFIF